MKNFKFKKLVAVALAVMTIATFSEVGASAAWKQDSNGWWNTEGSSWSTGWRSIDNTWYYFGADGYMKTGWVYVNGIWYYLQSSGAMKIGWVNDNGTWYFTNSSGAMQTGIVEVDGKVYYLAASGSMAKGIVTIGSVAYTFAESGEAIGDKIPTATVAFTSDGVSVTPSKPATDTTKKTDTTDTTVDTDTTSSGGGSSHHHKGSSSSNEDIQTTIDTKFADQLKVEAKYPVISADGKTTTYMILLQQAFKDNLGKTTTETINDVEYEVKREVFVTLEDGTDVGIDGTSFKTDGYYAIPAGTTATISTIISLTDKDGNIHYATPEVAKF